MTALSPIQKHAAVALWEMREHRELIPDVLWCGDSSHTACTAGGKKAPPPETLSAATGVLWFLSMDEGAAREIARSGVMPALMTHLSSKTASVRFNAAGCLRCLSFDDEILNAMIDPDYVIPKEEDGEDEHGGGGEADAGKEGDGAEEEEEEEEEESGSGGGKGKGKGKGGKKSKSKGGNKGNGKGGDGVKVIKNPSDLPHLKVCNDATKVAHGSRRASPPRRQAG